MERKRFFSSGFTLMEIMLVMVIIGILVTIVGGSMVNSQKRSRDVRRKGDLKGIASALEMYYNDKGRYPVDIDNSGDMEGCGATDLLPCAWGNTLSDSNATVYMAILPKDVTASKQYFYDGDASGTYFQIYARLENYEDSDIPKSGGIRQYYSSTNCAASGTVGCNYGISSPATSVVLNHNAITDPN